MFGIEQLGVEAEFAQPVELIQATEASANDQNFDPLDAD